MIESFEIMPAESLAAAVAHLPGARAPLAGAHPWHVLIEAVTGDAQADPTAMLEAQLAHALEDGVAADGGDRRVASAIRGLLAPPPSLSDAERALGPAVQHDIAVPVDAMPRFMVEAAAACDARFPAPMPRASAPGRRQISISTSAPPRHRSRPLLCRAGRDPPLRHDLVMAGGRHDFGRARHRPDEARRTRPPVARTRRRDPRHQDGARSARSVQSGKLVACA